MMDIKKVNDKKNDKERFNLKKMARPVRGFSIAEIIIIIIITGIVSSLATGVVVNSNYMTSTGISYKQLMNDDDLKEFLNVYAQVLDNYYKDVDKKGAMESALKGLLEYLGDDYTTYMDKDSASQLTSELAGSYVGIGISLASDGTVAAVFDDSPAKNAGIQVNDLVVSINDKDVTGNDGLEISSLIKSDEDKNVTIKVKRGEEYFSYSLALTNLDIPAIVSKTINNNNKSIGYIAITSFSNTLTNQVSKALSNLKEQNITGLIIDVRNNGGGYLNIANDVASLFLEKGKTIYSLENKDSNITYKDETDEMTTFPIVVLTNGASASASEILTAALKDSYGALSVGTTSYGKGKVQQTKTLDDGSMVKYTTARWLTPNGICIDGEGIKPDYEIELQYNMDEKGNITGYVDTQLNQAIDILTK